MGPTFDALMQPYGRTVFDQRFWNRRPVMLRPGPEIASALADPRLLDLVALCDAGHQDFKIEDFEIASGGTRRLRLANADDTLARWAADPGATIVARDAHYTLPVLAEYCTSMLRSLRVPVRTLWPVVYYSHPASGFPRHWDNHENFIFGLSGTKTFSVAPNTVLQYPTFNADGVTPTIPELADEIERERTTSRLRGVVDYEVGEHDCLFIPRGWWHEASATGGPSVTLTTAVWTATWEEVLLAAGRPPNPLASDLARRTPVPLTPQPVPDALAGPDLAVDDGPTLLAMVELRATTDLLQAWAPNFEGGPAPAQI